MSLCALSLTEAAADVREGRITSAELVADCLKRVDEVEAKVQAWAFLDGDHAMRQAEAADLHRKHGKALGSLHGVPIGIKDIFDTGDMPTELGSPVWAGRTPRRDAAVVARLRAAGAVIMGKTVTTEYAYFHPGKTTNPHDAGRTPGGSSSGSAAAVAAHMVPGAVGSQTNGSVIRPAAFCGVVGFKPTHGLIPRSGALLLSRSLDHVGVPPTTAPVAPAAGAQTAIQPRLRVPTIDGNTFDLAAQRGKWTVVNFWATWCGPCLKEMPELSALDAMREHIVVVGLAYEDTTAEDMLAFLKQRPVVYPIALVDVYDPPQDFETPRGLPMTYLIAPDGKVAKKYTGPVTAVQIETDIAAAGGPKLG